MDILLLLIEVFLLGWRFSVCLGAAVVVGTSIGYLLGPVAGFSLALFGVGFGLIWQGRWLSGTTLFASVTSPPISRPVACLGLSFIGALWGGFAAEAFGSILSGALALITVVALGEAFRTVVFKRYTPLSDLVFFASSLLLGLGAVYAISMLGG